MNNLLGELKQSKKIHSLIITSNSNNYRYVLLQIAYKFKHLFQNKEEDCKKEEPRIIRIIELKDDARFEY